MKLKNLKKLILVTGRFNLECLLNMTLSKLFVDPRTKIDCPNLKDLKLEIHGYSQCCELMVLFQMISESDVKTIEGHIGTLLISHKDHAEVYCNQQLIDKGMIENLIVRGPDQSHIEFNLMRTDGFYLFNFQN